MEKAEVFNALVLTGKTLLQQSQASEMCGKDWNNPDLPSGKVGDVVKVYLKIKHFSNLKYILFEKFQIRKFWKIYNSMVPDGVHCKSQDKGFSQNHLEF